MTTPPAPRAPARLRLIALCAAASLLPLLLLHGQFQRLYWFGDEWDLLLDLKEGGFWPWVATAYGENFAPLFKLLWGGALLLGGGNYAMIITLCWLNHALAVLLLGVLLSRAGWGRPGCALALLVFGLSTTNLEVLGWSMEWAVVLSATFLLAGALVLQRAAAAAKSSNFDRTPSLTPTARSPLVSESFRCATSNSAPGNTCARLSASPLSSQTPVTTKPIMTSDRSPGHHTSALRIGSQV